jgi:hypothetical protein
MTGKGMLRVCCCKTLDLYTPVLHSYVLKHVCTVDGHHIHHGSLLHAS